MPFIWVRARGPQITKSPANLSFCSNRSRYTPLYRRHLPNIYCGWFSTPPLICTREWRGPQIDQNLREVKTKMFYLKEVAYLHLIASLLREIVVDENCFVISQTLSPRQRVCLVLLTTWQQMSPDSAAMWIAALFWHRHIRVYSCI